LLILAVCCDCRYRIPNWLIAVGHVAGLLWQGASAGKEGIAVWFLGVICPIIILYILFYCKMLGAGDIKLLSVIGGFGGFSAVIEVMICSVFFGGLLSVIFLLKNHNLKYRMQYLKSYISNVILQKKILPYGGEIQGKKNLNREEHIKRGHVRYCAAILCAVVWCRFF